MHVVGVEELTALATGVMTRIGCDPDIAAEIAGHLVGADLRGVQSHGTMRLTQYGIGVDRPHRPARETWSWAGADLGIAVEPNRRQR